MDEFGKNTGHSQPGVPSRFTSAFFVHQQQIGFELAGEQYGRRFAPVERK